ncbi:MAG: hypothetical protein WBK19_15355 [Azonexus sp.]
MSQVAHWESEACRVAAAFRLGSYMQAGDALADLVRQIAAASGAGSADRQAELAVILEALLACHKRDDWLGVADYLQFELVDWLHRPELPAP